MSAHTPGPWEYVAGTEHHGPYVSAPFGGDICDCYTMSNPEAASVRNGGHSRPIWFHAENADANARLIARAPDMEEALLEVRAYFEDRADAEYFTDRPEPVGNEEMHMLALIDRALGRIP